MVAQKRALMRCLRTSRASGVGRQRSGARITHCRRCTCRQHSRHQAISLAAGKGLMARLACNMAEEARAREDVLDVVNHM